jgi:hypothetical protein
LGSKTAGDVLERPLTVVCGDAIEITRAKRA